MLFLALTTVALAASPLEAWRGHWGGDCRLSPAVQGETRMRMELVVGEPGPRTSWKIIYDSPKFGRTERPYELVAVKPDRGEYVMDEKNGILLDQRLEGRVFRSDFEVQGKRIAVREELDGSRLRIEMITWETLGRATGMGVKSYRQVGSQLCELFR